MTRPIPKWEITNVEMEVCHGNMMGYIYIYDQQCDIGSVGNSCWGRGGQDFWGVGGREV